MRPHIDKAYTSEEHDAANENGHQDLGAVMRTEDHFGRTSHSHHDYQSITGTHVPAYPHRRRVNQQPPSSAKSSSTGRMNNAGFRYNPYGRQEVAEGRHEPIHYRQPDIASSVDADQSNPPNESANPTQGMHHTASSQTYDSNLDAQPRRANYRSQPQFHGNSDQSFYHTSSTNVLELHAQLAPQDMADEDPARPEPYSKHIYEGLSQHVETWSDYSRDTNMDLADPFEPKFQDRLSMHHGDTQPWAPWLDKQVQSRRQMEQMARIMHDMPYSNDSHTSNADDAAPSDSDATMLSTEDSSLNEEPGISMDSSQATIRPEKVVQSGSSFAQSTPQRVSTAMHVHNGVLYRDSQMAPWQSTPEQTSPIAIQQRSRVSSRSTRSNRLLPFSSSQEPNPVPLSPTRSSIPEVLSCRDCNTGFTGVYQKGNLARHRKQKHRGMEAEFVCEVEACPKTFKRMDARLKHYRNHHSEIAFGPRTISSPQQFTELASQYPSETSQSTDEFSQFFDEASQHVGGTAGITNEWQWIKDQHSDPTADPAHGQQIHGADSSYGSRVSGAPYQCEHDFVHIGTQLDPTFVKPIVEPAFESSLEWNDSNMDKCET